MIAGLITSSNKACCGCWWLDWRCLPSLMVPPWLSKDFPLILEVFRKFPDRFPKFPILVSTVLKLYTMFLTDTKLNVFPSVFSDWFITVYISAFDNSFYGCTRWSLVNVNIISFCQWKFSSVFGNTFMENIKVNMKDTGIFLSFFFNWD